jgi:EAL domain-containing protein (putative c-di-GMP-specific phosphodiesterase class I)
MIELGRSLGLSVTVEGVETVDQLKLLKAKGLNELQGYLFSRPLSATDLARLDLDEALGGPVEHAAPAKTTPVVPLRLVS